MPKSATATAPDVLSPIKFYCEKCFEATGFWPDERNYNIVVLGELCFQAARFQPAGYQDPQGDLYLRDDLETVWAQLPDTSNLIMMSEPLPIRLSDHAPLVESLLKVVNEVVHAEGPDGGPYNAYAGTGKAKINDNRIQIITPNKDKYLLFLTSAERGWRCFEQPLTTDDVTYGWTIPREFSGTRYTPFLPGCVPLARFVDRESRELFKALYNRSEKLSSGIALSEEPILCGRPDDSFPGAETLDTLKDDEFGYILIGGNFDFILIKGESDGAALDVVHEAIWFQFVNGAPTH